VQGHDLAGNRPPSIGTYPLVRGVHDARVGRALTRRDAGTGNALLPVAASGAPLDLRLGEAVIVASSVGTRQVILRVAGFYHASLAFQPLQVDNSVVFALANGRPAYAFYAYVDPTTANTTLDRIQAAVPSAQTYSLADTLAQITAVLDNARRVLLVIAALASLAGIVLIANTVALALLERRREVGILKALGYTSRGVLGAVLVENGALGLCGSALALLLVAGATPLLGQALYGAPFGVPVGVVLAVVPATVVVCLLVAGGVAWSAAGVRPLEVLRDE
jgi:ABC-type antimicrobial peptide transport system permease subunit